MERIYKLLLWLYPAEHRREYGELMLSAFRKMAHEVYQSRGAVGLFRWWVFILMETLKTAWIERRDAIAPKPYSKTQFALVILPIIAVIAGSYLSGGYLDVASIYLMILVAGLVAWGLKLLKLTNPIWTSYTTGILFGLGGIVLLMTLSIPAFGVYRLELPPIFILILCFIIYAGVILNAGRLTGSFVKPYQIIALVLTITTITAMVINIQTPLDVVALFLSLNYALMQTAVTLVLVALAIYLLRRQGQLGLITLMVALGVQYIWIDPGYFTGETGRWIDLVVVIFPLILCPVWWLFAPTPRARLWGTFGLWAILIGVAAFVPSIARTSMMIYYPGDGYGETPAMWVMRAMNLLPHLLVMGLALASSVQASEKKPTA